MNKLVVTMMLVLATSTVRAEKPELATQLQELVQAIDSGGICRDQLRALSDAKVPGSQKVSIANDTPQLGKGEHTLDELRPVCQTRDEAFEGWERWAINGMYETGKIGGHQYYDTSKFKNCIEMYDEMIKAGVAKTTRVRERTVDGPDHKDMTWTGTAEELRVKWCDIGLKTVQAETDVKEAPFRKVLKNDKLSMALESGAFFIPGGALTSNPKQLAAATVWFAEVQSINDNRARCNTGAEIHIVHRYQFNAAHKLVKVTDKQYCDKAPKSAFR